MEKVRKYRLVLKQANEIYIRYWIDGLKMAFYKNYDSKLDTFGGICGLVRNSRFPGYCNLCMTFHSTSPVHFEYGYTVEFSPLFNKDGEKILIRHNSDELCASIDRGYMDYDTREFVDCELTMWRHGAFEGFRD